MTDTNQLPQIPDLTNERIDYIADLTVKGMPDGIRGFLVSWGWRQFARALMSNFDETMRAYALQARAQVHPAQAEVTDHVIRKTYSDVMTALREENGHVIGGAVAIEIDMPVRFARAILALRPVQVPMTDEQLRDCLRSCQHDTVENLRVRWLYAKEFARAIEAHHGITAQAKKETP